MTRRNNHTHASRSSLQPRKVAPWQSPEDEPEQKPVRGESAVQHGEEPRGRRSNLFPDLNITATAERLGITKSHLAKVLKGQNRPSIELAQKIADALGKDLQFVASLFHNRSGETSKPKPKKRK